MLSNRRIEKMRRINVTNAIKLIKKFKKLLIGESALRKHSRNPIHDYPYLLFTVFEAAQSPLCLIPPVSLGKSWSLTISLKNYIEDFRIRNYFKKDFLNFSFHYVRYCNHLVTFLEKFPHQFAFFKLSIK